VTSSLCFPLVFFLLSFDIFIIIMIIRACHLVLFCQHHTFIFCLPCTSQTLIRLENQFTDLSVAVCILFAHFCDIDISQHFFMVIMWSLHQVRFCSFSIQVVFTIFFAKSIQNFLTKLANRVQQLSKLEMDWMICIYVFQALIK
jgi:hypothetical protein